MSQTLKCNTHSRSLQHVDSMSVVSKWLKQLPVEERYLQVRLNNLAIVAWIRQTFSEDEPKPKEDSDQSSKRQRLAQKNFFDNLVLTSEHEYMDTVGFEFSLIDDVDRFMQLLTTLAAKSKSLRDYAELPTSVGQLPAKCSRELLSMMLANFMLSVIRQRCLQREFSQSELEQQRLRKRQYGSFWNSLELEGKQKFVLLGSRDIGELLEQLNIRLTYKQIERELKQLLKLQKNQFCNRLLKCKLKRCNDAIRKYYKKLFECLNEKVGNKPNIIRRRLRRTKTSSCASNQTNQTDIDCSDKVSYKVNELTRYKVENDLMEYANILSDKANTYYKHRQIAYCRIQHILSPYGVQLQLFGSCANGIALEKSDVDIAVSGNILSFFPYGTMKEKTVVALQSIHNMLAGRPWIVESKPITTAAIPVLKIQINTGKPMDIPLPPELLQSLNIGKDDLGDVKIQVDLTVDNRGLVEPEHCHLGLKSTELIGKWIEEMEGLYNVLILIKYLFSKKGFSVTYKGGISPYCVLVMIRAYIQYAGLPLDVSSGVLLEGVLQFFGHQFDERMQGIDLNRAQSPFFDRQQLDAKLQVKDPLNGRVMTRNAFLYPKIKQYLLELKAICIDSLKSKIRQHLTSLSEKQQQECLKMSPQQYFHLHHEDYPKNAFFEFEKP